MNSQLESYTVKRQLIFFVIVAELIIGFGISTASAAQCYTDAKAAYVSLMANEQHQIIAARAALNQAGVNINTASEGELTTLTGIGSKKAQEIILYREMFGTFNNIDELSRVKGIGKKTIDKNRQRLRVQ